MSEQKTGCVPDGYMPIPTAEQIADALESVRCFHDMSAELIAPRLLANLLASTTVKAEQVQCEVCHSQGEVYSGHDQHFHYFDFQPPEPIMEVCPECGGEEAPSLPAAVSADLTAVRCQCCATEYPHDSYDAGFIDGSGMCPNCDAAIPAKDIHAPAARDVLAERRRQIEAEGMTTAGDDGYHAAELPRAAAAYILNGSNDEAPCIWPWAKAWWKPRDARSNYVRAGALILAEIERLDRAALSAHDKQSGGAE